MNPDTNVPAFIHHESPREFFRRTCLMGNQRPPNRHRVLAHRLRKLGFEVRRIMRRSNPPDQWEVYLGIAYHGVPPAVDMFRECLRHALSALGYRCPRGKIRVRLTGFRLKMSFPWPPAQRGGSPVRLRGCVG